MGKRKSKARVITKKIASVPTQFDCLFCNHAKTVECKLNQVTNLGTIRCRVCNVSFQMEINHLHDPIDVYSEWIDETEKANRVVEDEDELREREADRARVRGRERRGEEDGEEGEGDGEELDADEGVDDDDEEERARARQKRKREERKVRDEDDDGGREEDEEDVEDVD